jgi:hypothetical protein
MRNLLERVLDMVTILGALFITILGALVVLFIFTMATHQVVTEVTWDDHGTHATYFSVLDWTDKQWQYCSTPEHYTYGEPCGYRAVCADCDLGSPPITRLQD